MMYMQRNTTKKYTIILLTILFITTALFVYIRVQKTKAPQSVARSTSPIDITPLIVSKLQQLVRDGSDGLYQLSIEQLQPDITTAQVDIIKAKLIPDSAVLQQLNAAQKAPDDVFTIAFETVHITGLSVTDFLHTKDIRLDTVFIRTPFIQVAHTNRPYNAAKRAKDSSLTLYQKLTKQLNSIAIRAIVVQDGSFITTDYSQQRKTTHLKDVNIEISDLKIDSATQYDSSRFLFSKKASFSTKNYVARTPDSLYLFKVGSFAVAADKHQLIAKDVALDPRGNKETFAKKLKKRNDMFTVHFKEIVCNDVDWWSLINNNRLYAGEVMIQNGVVKDYFNRALPPAPSSKKDNFPQQLLAQVSSKIYIQQLRVQDIDVSYEEYNPNNKQTGIVTFNNITGTIENVTNVGSIMKAHPQTVCSANALFMNTVPVSAHFQFNLSKIRSGAFSSQLHIGALTNQLINPIAEPMGMFTLKSGNIKEAAVQIWGDNNQSTTKMTMLYDDLKIFPLKKDDDGKNIKKKNLIGFLANTFTIKDANPGGNETPRSPEVLVQRGDSGSFFNFIWKSVLTGIVKTIGLPKKFANA